MAMSARRREMLRAYGTILISLISFAAPYGFEYWVSAEKRENHSGIITSTKYIDTDEGMSLRWKDYVKGYFIEKIDKLELDIKNGSQILKFKVDIWPDARERILSLEKGDAVELVSFIDGPALHRERLFLREIRRGDEVIASDADRKSYDQHNSYKFFRIMGWVVLFIGVCELISALFFGDKDGSDTI